MEVLQLIISALGAAIVAGIFSLLNWGLNRKAEKNDKKDELIKKLNQIEEKLDKHIAQEQEEDTNLSRIRILRFCDEVKQGVLHTEEHWNEVLGAIDAYEDYCEQHKSYSNNKAVSAIAYLKKIYAVRLEKNDFLK